MTRFRHDAEGLARAVTGDLVRDVVSTNRAQWIGPGADGARDSHDVGILFKLLDAGQRLGVHAHPDRAFARNHLSCPYGKTEAWLVLGATPGASVHLGWSTTIDPTDLAARRDAQDSEWMLAHLNHVDVQPGMGILVPAGTPHSIDRGVFVAEVQEPTDFSILLEWSITTSTRDQSNLGLGFSTAMDAVSHDAMPPDALQRLIRRNDLSVRADTLQRLLPASSDEYFRLELLAPVGTDSISIAAGFAILLVLSGTGRMTNGMESVDVLAGSAFVVPHAYGPWQVSGEVRALLGRPGAGWPASLNSRSIK